MIDNYITRGCLKKHVENAEDGKFQCPNFGCNKLNVFDWLETIPDNNTGNFVEVRFKNTRKGFYINSTETHLVKGEIGRAHV